MQGVGQPAWPLLQTSRVHGLSILWLLHDTSTGRSCMLNLSYCPAALQNPGPDIAEPLYDMSHEEAPFSVTVKRKGADKASPAVFDTAGHRLVFKVGPQKLLCSTSV